MNGKKMPVSVPWYSSETDFKEILKLIPVAESGKALPYREFVSYLETLERGVALGEQFPVRIEIKPDAIKAWCKTNDKPICRASIAEYAAVKMIEKLSSERN